MRMEVIGQRKHYRAYRLLGWEFCRGDIAAQRWLRKRGFVGVLQLRGAGIRGSQNTWNRALTYSDPEYGGN